MHTTTCYSHWTHPKVHLSLVKEPDDVNNAAPSHPPSPNVGTKISAHLDVGTIVSGLIGFMLVFLVNLAVGKLDKLTDEMALLNTKMVAVITRSEWQEKKDAVQDERLAQIADAVQMMQQRISRLEK